MGHTWHGQGLEHGVDEDTGMEHRVQVCTAVDKVMRAHETWMCGTDDYQMACMCAGHASR